MSEFFTEQEASKMICPFRPPNCVGDKCMLWRWGKEKVSHGVDYKHTRIEYVYRNEMKAGFCGLVPL